MTCSELTVCTLHVQVNLDSYALPIKKLKGAEPVESLDLSNKGLSVASAIVIASLIGVNGGLMEVWQTCQPTASRQLFSPDPSVSFLAVESLKQSSLWCLG